MIYPDIYTNRARARRLRIALVFVSCILFFVSLFTLKSVHHQMTQAHSSLSALQHAETLLVTTRPFRPVAIVDLKQKAYLAELNATAARLSVDWGARIARVESSLSPDLSLNAFRIDAQKSEIEIKGETSSNAKLTSIVTAMQSSGLDARVGRLARLTNGLEYSILISWRP
jgi:hypothetical protein